MVSEWVQRECMYIATATYPFMFLFEFFLQEKRGVHFLTFSYFVRYIVLKDYFTRETEKLIAAFFV